MSEQLQSDFDEIVKTSKLSNEEIQFKKKFLNDFIKRGFPNRKQEDWKFLDISQIIKKSIRDISFFNDYSFNISIIFYNINIFLINNVNFYDFFSIEL